MVDLQRPVRARANCMGRKRVSLWQYSHRPLVANRERERPTNPPSDYEFTGPEGTTSRVAPVKGQRSKTRGETLGTLDSWAQDSSHAHVMLQYGKYWRMWKNLLPRTILPDTEGRS